MKVKDLFEKIVDCHTTIISDEKELYSTYEPIEKLTEEIKNMEVKYITPYLDEIIIKVV